MIPGKKIIVLLFIKFPLVISARETLRDSRLSPVGLQ